MAAPIRIRKIKMMPLAGLMSSQPADTLEDSNSPRCLNVHFRFGEVRARPGTTTLGTLDSTVQWLGNFYTHAGLNWILALTSSKMWKRGNAAPGTPPNWYEITGTGIVDALAFDTTVGEDYFFFTQGGAIYKWGGTGGYTNVVAAEGTMFTTNYPAAKFVEYWNDRLVIGYTIETSGTWVNRIRWPENGAYTLWDDTVGEGAGSLDLYEEGSEPITGMMGLRDNLVAYKNHSIINLIATGSLDPVHIAQTVVRGIGCGAPWTLCNNGWTHFFLGYDRNVWSWDGIRLTSIGDPILEELRALTSIKSMDNYFAGISTLRGEYWLVIDEDNVFVYDWARKSWTRDSFPSITAIAEVEEALAALTWNEATGTWDESTRRWSDLASERLTTMFAGRSGGAIFQVDEQFVHDYFAQGSITDKYVETPDFYFPNEQGAADPWVQGTIKQVFISYRFMNANPVEIGISLDRGISWFTQDFIPIEAGYSQVSFNRTGNVVRFRFRQRDVSGQCGWRQFAYEFVSHGPYRPA